MDNMGKITEKKDIQKLIDESKKDKDTLAVALFGSSARGEKEHRDVDLCLILNKKPSNKEMSEKKMKYFNKFNKNGEKIDIQIFQQLPVYIRIRIIKEGKILFCRNEDELYSLVFSTIKEFDFYEKLYNLYLSKVENG